MRLYLIRHGEAVSKEVDKDRPLSKEGRLEVEKVADFIDIKANSIWVSSKLRAKQTAKILKEHSFCNDIVEKKGLGPNDPTTIMRSKISRYDGDLIIVGHMPFLSYLASALLSQLDDCIDVNFNTASVLSLEVESKTWSISWFLNPDLIEN